MPTETPFHILSPHLSTLQNDPNLMSQLVSCYQSVFRAKPWFEEHDEAIVESRIKADLSRPKPITSLALSEQNQVIGFIWGFGCSITDATSHITQNHLNPPQPNLSPAIESSITQNLDRYGLPHEVAWGSELGILPDPKYRGNSRVMAALVSDMARQQLDYGNPTYLFWTKTASPIERIIRILEGEKVLDFNSLQPGDSRILMAGDANRVLQVLTEQTGDNLSRYFRQRLKEISNIQR